jgi:formate-dependent nitrite reductase membrane component NrfD
MNFYVADPEWGWLIVAYFYLGGIAAGAYFFAALIDLFGGASNRDLPRVGYWIAFPLILACGLLLTIDLGRPERFWHMLLRSGQVQQALDEDWPAGGWSTMLQAPLLKRWSPMSVGSWALAVFGVCSGLSFLGSIWSEGRLFRWLRRGLIGRTLQLLGSAVGFFVAGYTGTLLSATNQPLWSETPWVAPLFLASAASTGATAMILLSRLTGVGWPEATERLERADMQAILYEAVIFICFAVSLAPWLGLIWKTTNGKVLLGVMPLTAILLPLVCRLEHKRLPGAVVLAGVFTLIGGFLLRYAILTTPPELLRKGPSAVASVPESQQGTPGDGVPWMAPISPEDGRQPGDRGADPNNRPADLRPRTKVFDRE